VNKATGNKIRQIRISKNFNPKFVADEIGMLDTSYSKIEREGTNSLSTLVKIAHILGVNPLDIIVVDDGSDPSRVEETINQYGFATKKDISELDRKISTLSEGIEMVLCSLRGETYQPNTEDSSKNMDFTGKRVRRKRKSKT